MDSVASWIQNFEGPIKNIGTAVIAIVVIVIVMILVTKSITAFGKSKMNEGVKLLGFAILAVAIGIAGVVGVQNIGKLFGDDVQQLTSSGVVFEIEKSPGTSDLLVDIA